MRRIVLAAAAASTVALLAGCIVSDERTTITIEPDGSADMVTFRSNIRSTEKGGKAEEECRRYVAEFATQKDQDYARIVQAGGQVREAHWVRQELPYSNLTVAKLPHSSALEKFCTIEGKEGELKLKAHWSQDGTRRRFSIVLTPDRELQLPDPSVASFQETRRKQADGISETRFVVASGMITAAQGFTVADDKRSALLALEQIAQLLGANRERVEIFLEWRVNGE